MPYDALSDLPDAVQKLPKHAQEIYMSAFNSAFKLCKGNEGKAHGTAWAAVKMKYKQDEEGNWVAKEAVHPHGDHICVCPKCEEEVTVAEDVKCNTQECPKCGKRMRAKDIGERRESMESLSMENRRALLDAALTAHFKLGKNEYIWVEDMTETEVFYNRDRQSFKATYTIAEGGAVTIGKPEKVTRLVTYKAMEALQSKYSEIIQEAGKRNAVLDATRLKKIVELCQELLSSEEPDEEKAKEALKEADKALAWLKEQAVMKTEDGVKFPAAAYAYVPDPEKSTTWKLRLWEDPTKKVTRAQLGWAAAALSPGGFRGQKVAIPSADLAAVKRKIRAEYRKLDVEDEDIPRWVKEVETRERILNYIPLSEAKIDKGRAAVDVIKAGFNASEDRYYPAEMLKRDYKVFEGMKMYADHPTEEEDKARPERSIKDWVATLIEVHCDEDGKVTGVAEIIEPWMMQKLAALRDKGMLAEMGVSINAVGTASKATIDGKETLVIEKFIACNSVDFVTEPGAGGVVILYESDRNRDIDLVELATLREKRPDLIKAIEANVREGIQGEVKHKMELEEQIKEKDEQITTLTKERDDLKEAAEKAVKEKAKAEAQATIKEKVEAVDKAELPDAAKERLIERFKDAESADGIEEAIQSEKDYLAKLAESGKVKNLGPSAPPTEAETKALRESFKRMHPEWTDAQLDTAVTGR